jgi:hypothetical protein
MNSDPMSDLLSKIFLTSLWLGICVTLILTFNYQLVQIIFGIGMALGVYYLIAQMIWLLLYWQETKK